MKYKIIYSDPPWIFQNKNTGGSMKSGAGAHYDVMTVEEMCKMPIAAITEPDAVLFMWWVGSQPVEAQQLVKAWGFRLITMTGFVWIKKTKHGKKDFGMGFWTRAGSECMLIAVKGKPKRINASIRSVIEARKSIHSKKPAVFRTRIVDLCGDVPRLELFARGKAAKGWHVFGNEAENSISL